MNNEKVNQIKGIIKCIHQTEKAQEKELKPLYKKYSERSKKLKGNDSDYYSAEIQPLLWKHGKIIDGMYYKLARLGIRCDCEDAGGKYCLSIEGISHIFKVIGITK